MKINVKTTVGGVVYSIDIEENKEMEGLHRAIVLGNPPSFCNECKNDVDFKMDSNKDKEGNIYVNVVCVHCLAKAKLGQYKAGGYFWHDFKKWDGDKEDETPKSESPQKEKDSMNKEQIEYIDLLAGNVTLKQETKERLAIFVMADKTSFEAEAMITSVCSIIRDKEGKVPERELPY